MRALTITAVALNILLAIAVLLALAMVLPSGGQSIAAIIAVLLAVWLTFAAIYTRPDASGMYGMWQRIVRAAAWLLHVPIFLLSLCLAIFGSSLWPLLLALAPVTVFLILLRSRVPRDADKKKKWKATSPEDAAMLAAQLRAHYMLYKAEIDAMMQEFKRLLVEKHGMREDYVAKLEIESSAAPDIPVATGWHMDGQAPEEMADKLIDAYYFSRDANNPAIFERHMDTGEALSPDYDYDHWAHRNFGRSAGQKFATVVMLLVLGSCMYGIFFATFLPSAPWYYLSLGMSVALSAALCIRLYTQLAQGRLRTQPGKRKLKKADFLWLAPFGVFFFWFSINTGIGLPVTQAIGAPYEAVYAYKKKSSKPCLTIQSDILSLSRFCLSRDAYNALPKSGVATFKGKKSWFGESLEYMRAG